MTSSLVNWSVLLCAGWLLFGGAIHSVAQNKESVYQLYERAVAAAQDGDPKRQLELALIYERGLFGINRNTTEAAKWYRKAADQGNADAQYALGRCCANAIGVTKNFMEAINWYRKAATQGHRDAQFELGYYCRKGFGVEKDYVESYKWYRLAINKHEDASYEGRRLQREMTRQQVAAAEDRVLEFNKHLGSPPSRDVPLPSGAKGQLRASGTGVFITGDGYLVTSSQVVKEGRKFRLQMNQGQLDARLVRTDAVSGLAVLKADGNFSALPLIASRKVRLGSTPLVVALPSNYPTNMRPQTAAVEIVRLVGAQDDARYFQLSVPANMDAAGGALLDAEGNLIGLLDDHRNPTAGFLPPNLLAGRTCYAVKSSFLLGFLESLPDVLTRLKAQNATQRSIEDIAKDARQATVRVLVY